MTQESYWQAYQQGFGRTVRLLCSRGASRDYAEDVAQAAWLRGWQKLDQLRDEGMIANWVNSIAINYQRSRNRTEARYEALPELCSRIGIDLARLDAAKILDLCRPGDRVLFELQMVGLSMQEIAKNQGVSTTAIRIRFLRARRAVRSIVEGRASDVRDALREARSSPGRRCPA